jgi:hypothetical protein
VVSIVPQAVGPSQETDSQATHTGTRAQWLILGCYLLAAVAVTWRLWAEPAIRVQADTGDIDQFAWFMRYSATAIAHGRLPALETTAMNAPYGFNLMWNTSFLLPGILLTPVTLLAGPQTSLTLTLTLGFAGSAASLFLVLRQWGASITAAAAGGALYGFSPALLHMGIAHYHLQFAVLPPLIIHTLLRIITGRGSAIRNGIWLGVLVAAQLFIGEEMLIFVAVAGIVLAAVLAASRVRAALCQTRATAIGLATGAGVALVICGRALWVQFHGAVLSVGSYRTSLYGFVTPSSDLFFHTKASAAAVAQSPAQGVYFSYLGWPLLIVLLAATVFFWWYLKVRVAGVTFVVLELFSLGSHVLAFHGIRLPMALLPWYWLEHLPLLRSALPYRLPILADGAAAATLAFSLDQVRSLVPRAGNWRNAGMVATAVAVLALLPLIPLPYPASHATALPAGWQAVFARLRLAQDARVLVVPVPYGLITQPLRWQADTGEPGSMIGGDFIGSDQDGRPKRAGRANRTKTAAYIDALWMGSTDARAPMHWQVRADLASMRPAAVVAVTSRDSRLGRFLSRLFGSPTYQIGSVLAWRLSQATQSAHAGSDGSVAIAGPGSRSAR